MGAGALLSTGAHFFFPAVTTEFGVSVVPDDQACLGAEAADRGRLLPGAPINTLRATELRTRISIRRMVHSKGSSIHRMEPWGLAAKATSLALGDTVQSRPSPHAVATRAPRTAPVTGAPVVLADCSGPKEKTRE